MGWTEVSLVSGAFFLCDFTLIYLILCYAMSCHGMSWAGSCGVCNVLWCFVEGSF